MYSTVFFFTSGRGIDDELVRLLFLEEMIKDANLMRILFSARGGFKISQVSRDG